MRQFRIAFPTESKSKKKKVGKILENKENDLYQMGQIYFEPDRVSHVNGSQVASWTPRPAEVSCLYLAIPQSGKLTTWKTDLPPKRPRLSHKHLNRQIQRKLELLQKTLIKSYLSTYHFPPVLRAHCALQLGIFVAWLPAKRRYVKIIYYCSSVVTDWSSPRDSNVM